MFSNYWMAVTMLFAAGSSYPIGPQRFWESPPAVAVHRDSFRETNAMSSEKLRSIDECKADILAWYFARLANEDLSSPAELSEAKIVQRWYHEGCPGLLKHSDGAWAVSSEKIQRLVTELDRLRQMKKQAGYKGFETLEDYIKSKPEEDQAIIKFWIDCSEACEDKTGQWKARTRDHVVTLLRRAKLVEDYKDPMPFVKAVIRAFEAWQGRH
jgi:hypothetical protein